MDDSSLRVRNYEAERIEGEERATVTRDEDEEREGEDLS